MHRTTSFFLAGLLWVVSAGSVRGDEQPQITPDVIYGHKNGMALVMHAYRPKVANGVSRFSCGQKSWQAMSKPAAVPTSPQMAVAMANARTMWLS